MKKAQGVSRSHRSPKGNRNMRRHQPMCQCCRQTERQYFPAPVSAPIATLGTQANDMGGCPQALPSDLDGFA
jgi:hypothetical protein